jgi:hypothetical protein
MPKGGLKPAPFALASIGPPALNTIEGSLFQNTNTFSQGDVASTVVEGSLFQNTNTFNDSRVTLGNNVEGSLLEDPDTLFHGFIEPINLFGSLLSDVDTLNDGLVSPINLFGSLLSDTSIFNTGEILGLNQTISGSKIGDNIAVITSITSTDSALSMVKIVTLPNGSNVIGRLVIACVSSDGTPTFTWPAGWTEIFDNSASNVSLGIAYRVIDGTEGFDGSDDTITVTLSDMEPTAHITYLIENFNSSNIEASSSSSGTNTTPNPGSITPTGGYDNYTFIAVHANDVGTTTTTGYPSGYVNNQQTTSGTTGGCGIGGAHLIKVTTNEDPGTFTIAQPRNWIAATISVKSTEVPKEDIFNQGELGFGVINISGGLFQDSSTFNNGTVYFGVRLSTAQANRSQSTVTADPFTIETARPWIACTIAIRGS